MKLYLSTFGTIIQVNVIVARISPSYKSKIDDAHLILAVHSADDFIPSSSSTSDEQPDPEVSYRGLSDGLFINPPKCFD
ncbi:uncharacterized protein RAG0_11475 [Rhynchosporium agropyri]|uniref:Uncharacterized protein n=1 Tax=Rhynchosporium agropyri TaxID=914238 RepID=A0A1E1L458_9HELO|nr:uncharacterized protein RAG0_11475 [Rhynchosporium agropyri]